MKYTLCLIVSAMFLAAGALHADEQEKIWSPNKQFYIQSFYMNVPRYSEEDGSTERERLVIYSADGATIGAAHIWLVEPGGIDRVEMRGCEKIGWIGNSRIYCEGTSGPHVSIKRIFNAKTGEEIKEQVDSDLDPPKQKPAASHKSRLERLP